MSKLLLMMEKGRLPTEYKGKSLEEIDIDLNFPEENEGEYYNPLFKHTYFSSFNWSRVCFLGNEDELIMVPTEVSCSNNSTNAGGSVDVVGLEEQEGNHL